MQILIARSVMLIAAGLVMMGCRTESDAGESPLLVKISPAGVSEVEAWRLFDRSVSSEFTPSRSPVTVTLGRAEAVGAVKVFGPAPYRVAVRGTGGSSLGFDPIDLSMLSPGWHVMTSRAPTSASQLVVGFEALGAGGAVPELELWGQDDQGIPAARVDATAHDLPGGWVSYPADAARAELSAGNCAGFAVTLTRSPSLLRRAHLVYAARGLVRGFVVVRSINGLGAQGGTWIAGDGSARTIDEEIDPAELALGANEITLCMPDGATSAASVSEVRIVGELDRGVGLASAVTVDTEARDGSAILEDGAPALSVAAGERVALSLERLIAPDALVVSGHLAEVPAIDCVDRTGQRRVVAAPADAPAGSTSGQGDNERTVIALDGAGLACRELGATFASRATIRGLNVVGSGASERVDWPRLVVTSPPEHFGTAAWVGGFVAKPPALTGAIRVEVAGQGGAEMTGDFGQLLARADDVGAAWPVTVTAHLPDGTTQSRTVVLDRDRRVDLTRSASTPSTAPTASASAAQLDARFGAAGSSVVTPASATAPTQIRLGTHVGMDVPAGALAQAASLQVRHLDNTGIPPLDPGLVNVTAPKSHGFEFLPHGQRFAKPIEVILPYDPALIPDGMTEDDVRTYFFDTAAEKWKPLARSAIDRTEHVTRSATDHFTIMIDAVLAVPKNPAPLSFDPTALSSIGAASPESGIDLIEPPQASSTGDARVALPIRVPKGRGAYTPTLGIGYTSAAGSSWLGVGWDLALPRVEIDTRWGVPTYADGDHVRYVIDGAELVPTLDRDGPSCQSGGASKRYHARIEGGFAHVLRCGDSPSNYHWELRDRDGALFVYGESADARLASYETEQTHQGIFRWGLERVVDVHGNVTQLHYTVDDDTSAAEPARALYPASIDYTAGPGLAATYAIAFELDDGTRPDRLISGRAGFQERTRHLLRAVHVTFRGQVIRDYVLTYRHGQFDKTVLAGVRVYGAGGCAPGANAFAAPTCASAALLDEHTFDYAREDQAFAPVQAWQVQNDPDAAAASLGKGASASVSGGAGVTFGTSDINATFGVNGSYAGRKELVGVYDMNGDGLPDEVFDLSGADFLDELLGNADGQIAVLYNQSRPGLDPATSPLFAGSTAPISGLAALGGERQTGWGLSASGRAEVIRGTVGFAESTSRARRFLGDLDGDGFLDLVNANGDSLRGTPCFGGGLCFAPVAFGATHGIDPRTDPMLQGFAKDIESRMFVGDPVVQWIAPFAGTVRVAGTVQRAAAGGSDGVTVEAYHDDLSLGAVTLAPDQTGAIEFPSGITLTVAAGEAIYLRVKTGKDDGAAPDGTPVDRVDTDLTVTYQSACTAVDCHEVADPGEAREPSGAPVFAYDSQADFRVAGQPAPLAVPADGTLALHAQLVKQPALADLRVCVQRFARADQLVIKSLDRPCATSDADVTNLSGTRRLAAEGAVTEPLDLSAPVQVGQLIVVRVESDLSFDPSAVVLAPSDPRTLIAAFTEVCLPNRDGGRDCSTDQNVIATVPLRVAGFGAFVVIANQPPAEPFVTPEGGVLHVAPFGAPDGPFVFAARSNRHGIVWLQDCTQVSCLDTIQVPPFEVDPAESVTFEIVTAFGVGGPSTLRVFFADPDHALTAPVARRAFAPAPLATPFAGGYRGFRAAFWNEAEVFAPARLLTDLAATILVPPERRQQIARTLVPPTSSFGGAAITGNAPAWLGPQSLAFVAAAGLNASLIGGAAGSGNAGDQGGLFDRGYTRLSGTQSQFIAAGLVGVPGFSFDLQASKSTTDTTTDVIDLNGDGVLDVVTPHQTTLGAFTADTAGGGITRLDVGGQLRRRSGHEYEVGFGGKAVVRRTRSSGLTLDVDNADGPDQGFLGLSAGRGLGLGRTQLSKDLVDVNGDGLPDLVERDGQAVRVRLNLGSRFGAAEDFGQIQGALLDAQDTFEDSVERNAASLFDSTRNALQHETTITTHESGGFDFGIVSCSHSNKHTASRITRQLADINGDGLPDLLYKKHGENRIRVQLNRGGDFGPPEVWSMADGWPIDLNASLGDVASSLLSKLAEMAVTGPDVLAGTSSQDASANGCGVSIPIYAGISVNFSANVAGDKDTYELALFDIDGDGAPDHVLRKGRDGVGTVYVKHNLVSGRANLLKAIHRPLGGTITLDYTRTANTVDLPHSRQVLSRVEVDDGVDLGPNFASPNETTDITYDGGNYDRHEKEFFGFAKVTTRRADGVTAESSYDNTSYPLHGRLLHELRRDASGLPLAQHDVTYDLRPVTGDDGNPVVGDPACLATLPTLLSGDACVPSFPVVVVDDDTRYEGAAHKTRRMVDASADHDRFGNVLVSTDSGDDAITGDELTTQASYRNDTTRWILGRATSLQVRSSGTLLRARTGDYDEFGQVIAIHVATSAGGGDVATTTLGYDAFGNLAHVTTPPNEAGQVQTYDVTYDPDTQIYPVHTVDGFGDESTASYDLRFGIATSERDISRVELRRTLDGFGRITGVSGPYDTRSAGLTMEYHPEERPPRAVTVMTPSAPQDYAGPVPAPTTTVLITDGFGRSVEVRKTAAVEGVIGMTTSGLEARDEVGRVTRTQNPFFTAGTSTGFIAPQTTLATTLTYDALDRAVLTRYPDGATAAASYAIAAAPAPAGAALFTIRSLDPNGHARETYVDQLGRTRGFVVHPDAQTATTTSYDYLATGELSALTDAEGTRTALTYDLRGLRLSLDNPDDGRITSRFDLMGNRIELVEPNHRALGARIRYRYDRDRLTTIDYPSKPNVTFTYGAPGVAFGAGRIVQVNDETGSQVHQYGALGEVRRTLRTVRDPAHLVPTAVFDLRLTTDSFGRQLRIGYPDGETITNSYDAAGQLAQVTGAGASWTRTYATGLRYDVFGNRTRAQFGNGDVSVWTFDPARVRVTSLVTTLASSTRVQDLHYSYDPAGNPTQIDNTLPASPFLNQRPGTASQRFTFDGADRLRHATGSGTLGGNRRTTYDLTFAYSPSDNLQHKTSVHQIVNSFGFTSTPDDTNYDSAYTYGPERPHLPTRVGALSIAYDPSGNPTTRRTGPLNLLVQRLTWDDDNRLVQVEGFGAAQRNLYDAAGLRVLRQGRGITLFASPYFQTDGLATGTKHVFAGAMRVASVISLFGGGANPEPPRLRGTPFYVHDNHLGSTAVVTTESGDVHDAHEYFPDGAPWIDSGLSPSVDGFLFDGKPLDPDTGFYDFGQRFYDPRLSLWLGVDAQLKLDIGSAIGKPFALSPLAFAAHNPLRYVDPNGMDVTGLSYIHGKDDFDPDRVGRAVEAVAQRAPAALKLAGASAAFAGGFLLCETVVGCLAGAPIIAGSTDVATSASGELLTGEAQPTLLGLAAGPRAQQFEEGAVAAAGLAVPIRALTARAAPVPPERPPVGATGSRAWHVGDDVYTPTARGGEPSWSTVRSRFWRNEAAAEGAAERYGAENLERMSRGRAPQRFNPDKGGMESMELSHEPVPAREGGRAFVPRWPQDHAAVDPFRRPGY